MAVALALTILQQYAFAGDFGSTALMTIDWDKGSATHSLERRAGGQEPMRATLNELFKFDRDGGSSSSADGEDGAGTSVSTLCPGKSEFLGRYCIAGGESRLFKDLCFDIPKPLRSYEGNIPDDALQWPVVYGACPEQYLCLQDENPAGTKASIDCVPRMMKMPDNYIGPTQFGYRILPPAESNEQLRDRGVAITVLGNMGRGTVSGLVCEAPIRTEVEKRFANRRAVLPHVRPGERGWREQLNGFVLDATFFQGAELRDTNPAEPVCTHWRVIDSADRFLGDVERSVRSTMRSGWEQLPSSDSPLRGEPLRIGTTASVCRPDRFVDLEQDAQFRFDIGLPYQVSSMWSIVVYLIKSITLHPSPGKFGP